jgi:hypothetical protein
MNSGSGGTSGFLKPLSDCQNTVLGVLGCSVGAILIQGLRLSGSVLLGAIYKEG